MMENNIVNKDFLKEEEICGHLVTAQMKKLWAVQIGCLEELKRICKKYNITYFACGGTLLGAVRHKGYIPWDDDLDIMMFKDDYERFCEVAPQELQQPYFFQNFETEKGFGPGMSRIRNSDTTGCTEYEIQLASDGYNCGVFIDIFPLFGVEENKFKLHLQKVQIKMWWLAIAGYERSRKNNLMGERWRGLIDPSVWWWTMVSAFISHKSLSKKYLKACGKSTNYTKVGLLSFDGYNKRLIWDKDWFSELVSMPFEYTQLNCPKQYDPVLKTQYGNYMKFVKGGAIHTMALIDPETPYKTRLKNKSSSSI